MSEAHLWEDLSEPSSITEGPQDPLLLSDETKELDPPSPPGKQFMI